MNQRKATEIRGMMQYLRENPPSAEIENLVKQEAKYIARHAEPIERGRARVWSLHGGIINPTRTLKKIAARIVNNKQKRRQKA